MPVILLIMCFLSFGIKESTAPYIALSSTGERFTREQYVERVEDDAEKMGVFGLCTHVAHIWTLNLADPKVSANLAEQVYNTRMREIYTEVCLELQNEMGRQ